MAATFDRDLQYYKFCFYGFLKNLRFFEPFLVLFFLEKGLTFLLIGTLYSIREIAINLLEIPAGIVADAMGRRRSMVAAFAAYIVSFVIFHFSTGYYGFAVAMLVFSLGSAFRTGTHKAMIFEYLKIKGREDQKVYYYGHTRSYSQVGSALSSLIAAALVFYTGGFRVIFIYSVIPYVLGLLLMLTYPAELDGGRRVLEKNKIIGNMKQVVRDFVYSFKDAALLRAIGNVSLYSGFYKAARDYLQPVLNTAALSLSLFVGLGDRQRTAVVVGLVYFFLFLLNSLGARYSGTLAENFRGSGGLVFLLNATLVAGYVTGLLSGLFLLVGMPVVSMVAYMGIYLVQNLRKPMGIAYVSDMMRSDILATALSAESQVSALSAAVLAPVIGLIADRLGLGLALMMVSVTMLSTIPFYPARSSKKANRSGS